MTTKENFDALANARRTLEIEAAALGALAQTLTTEPHAETFRQVVERIAALRGRVALTGMGKSGHVARKIASTLASTGTTSFYVHPAEAMHGDLGMITRDDAVLALSNSGETPELDGILAYVRRWKILLIAMTGGGSSNLARHADLVLQLPPAPEACPIGLAPTSSTTMAMALGDALATALLERAGFDKTSFHQLHPGGRLGSRLRHVDSIMNRELPLVSADSAMHEAIDVISTRGQGCVGVLGRGRGQKLRGVITDGDLRRWMAQGGQFDDKVETVMTLDPLTVAADSMIEEAIALCNARKVTGLFVCDEHGELVGFLHLHDCLRVAG